MAMLSYPVPALYWKRVKDNKWSDHAALLGLYLQTSRHRNLEGLFHHPLGYMTADLGWTLEHLEARLQELQQDDFVLIDYEADVVLLPDAMTTYAPKSENQVKGAMRDLQLVPDTSLWGNFLLAAREHAPALFEELGGEQELTAHPPIPNRSPGPDQPPPPTPANTDADTPAETHPHTHCSTHPGRHSEPHSEGLRRVA